MAFFSILLPVYNVEKYLNKCLDSILSQQFDDYEVILIDDGSTDNSGSICDEYASKDERFIVHHKNNEGLLCARRDAIKMAKGKYILFLDSDDYWADDVLTSVHDVIVQHQCDLVIFSNYSAFENSIVPGNFIYNNLTVFEDPHKKELYDLMLTTDSVNALWRKAVKRSIVDVENDYREFRGVSLGEDLLQSAIYLINAEKIVYFPKHLYYYRRHTGMTSRVKPSYLNQITQSRSHITKLLQTTDYDLTESIDKQYCNYLDYIAKIIINCIQNGYNMKEAEEVKNTFNTDFYKAARTRSFNETKRLTKLVISLAEKEKYKPISFLGWLLKTKTKVAKKVRRK